jgi:hypothetical protein
MPVLTRLLSFGVTKGLAALLVLVLSVIGGVRTSFERISQPLEDERAAMVLQQATAHGVKTVAHAEQARNLRRAHLSHHVDVLSWWNQDHLTAPSHLLGSAGGPRAPTVRA